MPPMPPSSSSRSRTRGSTRSASRAPATLETAGVRESVRRVAARQPALGLAGLVLVVPVAVVLGAGAGGLEPSLRVLGPLSTFGLPVVAMIAFWWEDWPGTRLKAPL